MKKTESKFKITINEGELQVKINPRIVFEGIRG